MFLQGGSMITAYTPKQRRTADYRQFMSRQQIREMISLLAEPILMILNPCLITQCQLADIEGGSTDGPWTDSFHKTGNLLLWANGKAKPQSGYTKKFTKGTQMQNMRLRQLFQQTNIIRIGVTAGKSPINQNKPSSRAAPLRGMLYFHPIIITGWIIRRHKYVKFAFVLRNGKIDTRQRVMSGRLPCWTMLIIGWLFDENGAIRNNQMWDQLKQALGSRPCHDVEVVGDSISPPRRRNRPRLRCTRQRAGP